MGRDMLLAPTVNINRVPVRGRNFEGFGKDLTFKAAVQEAGVGSAVTPHGRLDPPVSRQSRGRTARFRGAREGSGEDLIGAGKGRMLGRRRRRRPMAMNSSIYHPVRAMIQPQSWACWYTSFQMVVRYARFRPGGSGLRDPADVEETRKMYEANQGIGTGPDVGGVQERERIARLLGFAVLYASLTEEGLWEVVRANPVIYAGRWPGQASGHFVVITGISMDTIAVNNPAVGAQTFNYRNFVNTYLLQTAERPLIRVPSRWP
jgi:hypothetical protein